jgi:hypothetical protein
MLRQFAKRKTTTEVITEELGMSPQDFDKQFLPWLEAQTKRTVEGFDEWRKKIKAVSEFAKLKAWDDVIKTGEGDSRSVSGLRRSRQRVRISLGSVDRQGQQGRRRWRSWRNTARWAGERP